MRILVIVANGFHLGYLGCYGNDWIAARALDRLAAEGIVFDQHYSDRPDARGARQTWRTGKYLFPEIDTRASRSNDTADLIPLLQAQGMATSVVIDSEESKEFALGWKKVYESESLEQAVEMTLTAVDELAHQKDWLLWMETSVLLPPWNVPAQFSRMYFEEEGPEEDNESQELNPLTDPTTGFVDENDDATLMRLQKSYGPAVSYLDSGLEALFEELQTRGVMDDIMIVVTTDRGFPLGEHGMVGFHRPWLHDELIHIPLLVRLPGGAEAGRRVSTLTQPVDLMPTILEAFGRQIPTVHGKSLLPLIRGENDSHRSYACSGLQIDAACEWALRTKEWALILPVQTPPADARRFAQLYVKPDDRWEVNNVLQHNPDLAENLERVLRGFVEATHQPGPLRAPELKAQGLQPLCLDQSHPETGARES